MKAEKRKVKFMILTLVAALLAALIVGMVFAKSRMAQSRISWYLPLK